MGRWVAALIASLLMLLVGPAASASGAAAVRFVQAVPGAGPHFQLHATEGGITQKVGRPGRVRRRRRVRAGARGAGHVRAARARQPAAGRADRAGPQRRPLHGRRAWAHGGAAARGAPRRRRPRRRVARCASCTRRRSSARSTCGSATGRSPARSASGTSPPTPTVEPGAYACGVTRPGDGSALAARGAVPLTAGTVVDGVRGRHRRRAARRARRGRPLRGPARGARDRPRRPRRGRFAACCSRCSPACSRPRRAARRTWR